MPSKCDVLEQLKRDELLAAVDRLGLEVQDRRARTGLVEALAGSRKAALSRPGRAGRPAGRRRPPPP
jgi:hypothetical protein